MVALDVGGKGSSGAGLPGSVAAESGMGETGARSRVAGFWSRLNQGISRELFWPGFGVWESLSAQAFSLGCLIQHQKANMEACKSAEKCELWRKKRLLTIAIEA